MVSLWRHLPPGLESPGKMLRRSWPKDPHLSSPGLSLRVGLDDAPAFQGGGGRKGEMSQGEVKEGEGGYTAG